MYAYKVSAISFGIGVISILIASYIILRVRPETYLWLLPIEFLLLVSLPSLVVSIVAGVSAFIKSGTLLRTWTFTKDPLLTMAVLNSEFQEEDLRFVAELRDTYDAETLNFLAKRIQLNVGHTRDFFGIIIGSPAQFKVFPWLLLVAPLAIAQAIALTRSFGLSSSEIRSFLQYAPSLIVPGIMLVGLFVLAIINQFQSERIEQLAQLLELATGQKKDMEDKFDQAASTAA